MSFELIRMLCVNSYKQGKVIELRMADGHVLILGRNGVGKTTLAQLIPPVLRRPRFADRRQKRRANSDHGILIEGARVVHRLQI